MAFRYTGSYSFLNDPEFQKTNVYKTIAPIIQGLNSPDAATRQKSIKAAQGQLGLSPANVLSMYNSTRPTTASGVMDKLLEFKDLLPMFLSNPTVVRSMYDAAMGSRALASHNANPPVARGTTGPGGAVYGQTGFSNTGNYSRNIAQTPGAGLYTIFGTPANGTNTDQLIEAWLRTPAASNYQGFPSYGSSGTNEATFGRNDAKFPSYSALLRQGYSKPEAFDMTMRANHYNAQLAPQGFDIGDILVPAGQMLLGAMGQPWLSAALGAGRDISQNGLSLSTPFAVAGGYGMGTLGSDLYNLGPSRVIGNAISDISDVVSNPLQTGRNAISGIRTALTGPSTGPTTLGGVATSTANTLNKVPSFLQPGNTNNSNSGILQGLGVGQATRNLTVPTAPRSPAAPTPTAPSRLSQSSPNFVGPRTPARPAATPMFGQLGGTQTVRRAMGGSILHAKDAMNPMGGAPASHYGLASLEKGGATEDAPIEGYLDGPGDGMSDSIKATIDGKQPARLADGEFVIPADVVSGLGNGSSKAGAKVLYAMMDRVRQARTGNPKQGKEINPNKLLPA